MPPDSKKLRGQISSRLAIRAFVRLLVTHTIFKKNVHA